MRTAQLKTVFVMNEAKVVTALQLLAMYLDWDEDEDGVLRILSTLRRAYPEATREQLIIAIKRAQTEIDLRITAVNGWHVDYDITDKCWEKLERMKVHSCFLYEAILNVDLDF